MEKQELLTRIEPSPKPKNYEELAELWQSLEPKFAGETKIPEIARLALDKASGEAGFTKNIKIKKTKFKIGVVRENIEEDKI
ncbi:hypothetical protein [Microseira sp. BLCC-F43]|jgi:hypothetical protein|uniref:hypothetical protein n=1 Tax=Microseira sp. BLCC-F43 TaxID=3153602 RepID=UPI0035B9A45D